MICEEVGLLGSTGRLVPSTTGQEAEWIAKCIEKALEWNTPRELRGVDHPEWIPRLRSYLPSG
jgi:hypothetical protein